MFKGSCSLQQHADRIDGDPADYKYYYFSASEGKWKSESSKTLDYAIEHSAWDFISLQQNSSNSGKPDTYSYLDTLVPHVLEKATNDDVKLLWHMTWPWSDQYSKIGPSGTYASQAAMYQAICSTVQEKISKGTFAAMIPAGTAVENVGSSHYSYDGLHRDDVHLSNVCRMAAAYTWYAALTGETVDANGFDAVDDANGLPVDMGVVVEAANNAIAEPFAITKSAYTNGYSSTDNWTALTDADTALSSGAYYLKDNLTATTPITVNGKVTLVLNGKTLTACTASSGSFITVADGGALTITDSGNGAISGAEAEATRGIEVKSGGTLVLNSGAISGFTTSGDGGGVLIEEGGTATMTGGKVLGNTAANGGGICNNNGTLTFSGGSVAKNRATGSYGGGVYNVKTFTMTGGTISANKGTRGDQVYSYNDCTAVISGGTITDWNGNTSEGVFGSSKSDITIKGNAAIESAVVPYNGGKLTIEGNACILGEIDPQGTNSSTVIISGGKFSDKMTREDLIGFLSADAGVLSVMNNTGADAAAYPYVVGEGYNRVGEFMDFKSSLDLTITLGADVGFTADDTVVTVNGTTVTPNIESETMVIPVNGIVAKAMDDEYTVVVKKGDKTLYSETLSVRKLAGEWHKDVAHADDKVMLEDMINYGIEAQREFKDGAVTMTALGTGTANKPDWGNVTGGVTGGHGDKTAITLSLKDEIELNIYVRDADATITGAQAKKNVVNTGSESVTRFTFDEIPVKDAKDAVEFTVILSDGVTVFDVKYSIADYAVMAKDGEQSALIEALMKYVDSVSAYLAQ